MKLVKMENFFVELLSIHILFGAQNVRTDFDSADSRR